MTIEHIAPRVQYTGDGSTVAFDIPFYWASPSEIIVIETDTDGAETTLVLNADYTLAGAGSTAGVATALVAPAAGVKWTILRATPLTQLTDLNRGGNWDAESAEASLDKLTRIVQDLRMRVDRMAELYAAHADGSGAFNARGNRFANLAPGVAGNDAAVIDQIPSDFSFAGAWQTATSYAQHAIVTRDGSTYYALQAHVSGSASAPGTGGSWQTYWAQLAASGEDGEDGISPTWHVAAGTPSGGLGADGDMYLNTSNGDVYGPKTGGAWGGPIANITGPAGAGTGDMLKSENLSGLANVATARANLGLGTAAVEAASSFAAASHQHDQSDITDLVADLASKALASRNLGVSGLVTGGGDLTADRTFTVAKASVSQFRSATADVALDPANVWDAADLVTITQAATLAVDLSAGINFTTTMTGNRTLGAPSNTKVGQTGIIRFVQDSTGTRTLAFNSVWKFPGGTAPSIETGNGAVSILSFIVLASNFIFATMAEGVS